MGRIRLFVELISFVLQINFHLSIASMRMEYDWFVHIFDVVGSIPCLSLHVHSFNTNINNLSSITLREPLEHNMYMPRVLWYEESIALQPPPLPRAPLSPSDIHCTIASPFRWTHVKHDKWSYSTQTYKCFFWKARIMLLSMNTFVFWLARWHGNWCGLSQDEHYRHIKLKTNSFSIYTRLHTFIPDFPIFRLLNF